jgi:hypothetical protein
MARIRFQQSPVVGHKDAEKRGIRFIIMSVSQCHVRTQKSSSQVVEFLLSLLLRLRGYVRVVHCSLEASSNIAKVLSFRVGLQIVELLLGLSLGFDAVVWVVNRTGSRYQY